VQQEATLLHQQLRVGFNVYHLVGSAEACQTWTNFDEVLRVSEVLKQRLHHMTKVEVGFDLENLTRLIDQMNTQSERN